MSNKTFNDYLKYVLGHSKDCKWPTSYADRICTAINRWSADGPVILTSIKANHNKITIKAKGKIFLGSRAVIELKNTIGQYSWEEGEIVGRIKYKIEDVYEFNEILDEYDDILSYKQGTIRLPLGEVNEFITNIVANEMDPAKIETPLNEEIKSYIIDGIPKINSDNVLANCIAVVVLMTLDKFGFLNYLSNEENGYHNDGEDEDEDDEVVEDEEDEVNGNEE